MSEQNRVGSILSSPFCCYCNVLSLSFELFFKTLFLFLLTHPNPLHNKLLLPLASVIQFHCIILDVRGRNIHFHLISLPFDFLVLSFYFLTKKKLFNLFQIFFWLFFPTSIVKKPSFWVFFSLHGFITTLQQCWLWFLYGHGFSPFRSCSYRSRG